MRWMAALTLACLLHGGHAAAEQRRPWGSFDPHVVTEALHAFRQTDHWIAEAMADNLDGDRLGRDNQSGRPFNFDPTRHLLYVVTDLNRDGRPEVFLLFDWPAVRGNRQASGVVMQPYRDGWRIACDFHDWGDESARGGIRLLPARSFGWQHFHTTEGAYAWRPVPGQPGAMECLFGAERRDQERRLARKPATRR